MPRSRQFSGASGGGTPSYYYNGQTYADGTGPLASSTGTTSATTTPPPSTPTTVVVAKHSTLQISKPLYIVLAGLLLVWVLEKS